MNLLKNLLIILSIIVSQTISAQTWTQQGSDIDGDSTFDQSGFSVSLSSDGSTVAIGAPYTNSVGRDAGHVRIYKNINGTWTQQGSDIDGEAAVDYSGGSVSLSSDGSTVAIGAAANDGNGSDAGHVRIYKNISGTWTQQGSDIDGEAADDRSGFSVSLSSDGSTVAIGAPANDGNGSDAGHVRVYKNINGTWTQQGSDIDGEAAGDLSGYSVSLSSDGSAVAIGAAANDGNGSNAGHLRIYKNISGTWTQQGSDIDGEAADDKSGFSVSLSSYGSTVAIGAYRNSGNEAVAGHVRVYNSNTFSTDNITACNSYTWTDGITYTASNTTAKDTFLNTAGRDSIVTLNLTMNSSSSSTDNITACNSYTWTNGVTYTSSNNTATDTFVNTAGCDSVVMLSLTVIETNKLISTQPEDQSVDVNKSTNIIVTSGYGDVATYQWQVDDGAGFKDLSNVGQYSGVLTDTLLVSNVTLLNDGEIFRCLVTVNDCSDTSETVLLTIGKVDVSELALTKDYAVYPNPTKGIVFISTKASLLGASYTVYSSSGALIRNGSITSEITTLDIQDLQEGIYFIQLGDDIQQSFKIIKK